MEKLNDDVFLKFHPDTLVTVRKEFGLDKPEVLKVSLDSLEKWISEQKHFVKMDFSREDLERILIGCKGSIEKAKLKIDQSCTIKNLLPRYFETLDARNDIEHYDNLITCSLLPHLTENHERIFVLRNLNYNGDASYFHCYQYFAKVLEYVKTNDYNSGIIVILDYTHANLKHMLTKINIVEMREISSIILVSVVTVATFLPSVPWEIEDPVERYIISPSKMIDTLVTIIKQVISSKIAKRIQVCKDYKKLFKDLPVAILPEEYEGSEKCIDDLHEYFLRALTSDNFIDYLKEMKRAVTNEKLRNSSVFNVSYLGAPGSLNNMIVD